MSAGVIKLGNGSLFIENGTLEIGGLDSLRLNSIFGLTSSGTVGFQNATLNVVGSSFSTPLVIDLFGESTINTNAFDATFSAGIRGFGFPNFSTTGITKIGSGTMTLAATSAFDNLVFREGGIELQNGAVLSLKRLTLAPNAGENVTFTLGPNRRLELAGGSAIVQGDGTSEFRLAGGTIRAIAGSDTIVPMTLSGTSTLDTFGQTLALGGVLSGSGQLWKTGSGILYLGAANTFSGGFRQVAGETYITNQSQLGTGFVTVEAGRLVSSAELSTDAPLSLSGGGEIAAGLFLELGVTGTATATISGGGKLTSAGTAAFGVNPGASSVVALTGSNSLLRAATNLYLGLGGSAVMTAEAGATIEAVRLILGDQATGSGSLHLNTDALLLVGGSDGIRQGAGGANFHLAGGGIRVQGADLTSSLAMTLTNASFLDTNGSNASLSGLLAGAGSLTKTGAGTLRLTNTNSFSGGLTVSGGTVEFDHAGNLGTGPVLIDGGQLRWRTGSDADISGRLSIGAGGGTLDVQNNAVTLAQSFSGAGSLRTIGSGTLALSGSNVQLGGNLVADGGEVFTSGTITLGGYLEVGSTTTAVWTANGGGVSTSSSAAFGVLGGSSGVGILNNASLTVGTDLFVGYLGSAALVANAGSTVSADNLILGAFTGPGTFVLNSGATLLIGGANAIRRGAGAGFFELSGGTIKVTSESLSTSVPMELRNVSTIDTSGVEATLSGVLSGAGGLVKTGGGNLYLSEGNTFSGGLNVYGGVVAVQSASGAGSGPLTIQGGTLQSSGVFARDGSVIVDGVSTLRGPDLVLGNSGSSTLAVTGGGRVLADNSVALGLLGGSSGKGTVTGAGSSLAAPLVYVGYLGDGDLAVGFGGTVTGNLTLGLFAGSSGTFSLNTGGTLQVGGSDGIARGAGSAQFHLAGGLLKVTNSSLTTSLDMTLASHSLIDTSGVEAELAGTLSGTGRLSKTGAGTLTLSGSNTFSGGLVVLGGTVAAEDNAAFGSGSVEVAGGTLLIREGYAVENALLLTGGALAQERAAGSDFEQASAYHGALAGDTLTDARLLDGTASASTVLVGSFGSDSDAINDSARLGSVFHFTGVPTLGGPGEATDIFVLELTLPSLAVTDEMFLAWFDSDSNQWVNAVDGNFGGTSRFVAGAYNPLTDFQLGAYGVDVNRGAVWAVLNHNSAFAVIPEPGTGVLWVVGLLVIGWRIRRRSGRNESTWRTTRAR